MINGVHVIVYSRDADAHADRGFVRDVLGFDGIALWQPRKTPLTLFPQRRPLRVSAPHTVEPRTGDR
jgi:hypothetical protein